MSTKAILLNLFQQSNTFKNGFPIWSIYGSVELASWENPPSFHVPYKGWWNENGLKLGFVRDIPYMFRLVYFTNISAFHVQNVEGA